MTRRDLHFEVIRDVQEARALWNALSTQESIVESWEFRYLFFSYAVADIFFYVGYEGDAPFGVLPLQYDRERGYLEFFGGFFMYDNGVLLRPGYEEQIPIFYRTLPCPANLDDIGARDGTAIRAEPSYFLYTLPVARLGTFEQFLGTRFNARSRATLLRKFRHVAAMQPNVVVNRLDDLEYLMRINKRNFGEESAFHKPNREEIFRRMLGSGFDVRLLSFEVGGALQAVSLALFLGGTYSYLNAGINWQEVSDLGTYVVLRNIEEAFALRARVFDAGVEDFNWKERLHLDRTGQYRFHTI